MKNCNCNKNKSCVCTVVKVMLIIGAIVAAAAFICLVVKKVKDKRLCGKKDDDECDSVAVDEYEVCDMGSLCDEDEIESSEE